MCYNFTIICKKIFIYYNLGGKELERREAIELLKKYNPNDNSDEYELVSLKRNSEEDKEAYIWYADFYKKYGYYKETQVSIVREGAEGAQEIQDMMTKTRQKDITEIAGLKVLKFKDIQRDIEKNMKNGKVTSTGLPTSNVLYYELENNNWCCVRPSGTEPKIKLYMGVKARSEKRATQKLRHLKDDMVKIVTE